MPRRRVQDVTSRRAALKWGCSELAAIGSGVLRAGGGRGEGVYLTPPVLQVRAGVTWHPKKVINGLPRVERPVSDLPTDLAGAISRVTRAYSRPASSPSVLAGRAYTRLPCIPR